MPNTSNRRWYDDPNTGLPTIRRSEQARNDATPEQVKAWMQGDGALAPAIEPEAEDDYHNCPTCGQSTDEEDDPQ